MSMTREILQEIISGAREPYVSALVSPQRKIALVTVANEMRMSIWVEHGSLYSVDSGQHLADFGDSMWSVDSAQWQSETKLALSLSHYPGSPVGAKIHVDLENAAFSDEKRTLPLGELCEYLDRLAHMPNRIAI